MDLLILLVLLYWCYITVSSIKETNKSIEALKSSNKDINQRLLDLGMTQTDIDRELEASRKNTDTGEE